MVECIRTKQWTSLCFIVEMWPEKFWEILKKRSLKIIQRLDLLEPIGGLSAALKAYRCVKASWECLEAYLQPEANPDSFVL